MAVTAETQLEDAWRLCSIGQPRAALSVALEVLEGARSADRVDVVAEASCRIAWFCFQLGDIQVGIDHAIEAHQIFQQLNNRPGECWALSLYAWLLHEAGMMELAAQYANDAVAIAETLDDDFVASWAFNVLAVIFWTSKQVDRALPWSERAISTLPLANRPYLLGWWLINLGGIHSETGYLHAVKGDTVSQTSSMRLALGITAEAMKIAEQEGDLWGLALTLCNNAEYHLAIGERDEAHILLERAAAISEISLRTKTHYLYTKAQYFSCKNQHQEALIFSKEALELARAVKNTDFEAHALKFISENYEGLGKYEQALHSFKTFYEVKSKLDEEKVRMRVRVTEAHYRTEHFKTLADQASRRAESLAAMTFVDPLTGVGNRRALDQTLADLHGSPVSYGLAVIDLDHFKIINDSFSHAIGDDVLRRVGAMLRTVLKPADTAIRMGGEEFVLVFTDVTLEGIMSICAGLLTCIRRAPWWELHDMLRVTASIGIAVASEASDPPDVLDLADRRLYAAKHAGRDRVVGGFEEKSRSDYETAPNLKIASR